MAGIGSLLAAGGTDAADMRNQDAALDSRLRAGRESLGPAATPHYDKPLELARGEGVYLFDAAGSRYLNMYNNVPLVGHGHPEVVSAIAAQSATLNIPSGSLSGVVKAYAARLLGHFPASLGQLVLTCSGSESNDLALRVARAVTGRQGVVVTRAAIHGGSAAVAEISPLLSRGEGLRPYVRTVPAPDAALAGTAPLGSWFAARVRAAITALEAKGAGFAALILDGAFASDGVFTDPPGFLAEAVAAVRAAGGLFIADEVQAGFGRMGGGLWGFTRHGVVPDIVTLGKPMGNGYPMGGMVTRPDYLARASERSPCFSSCGASPVAAAAGMAVLDVIEGEGLVRNAVRCGEILKAGLRGLAKRFACLGAVRGAGLIIGVDVVDPQSGAPDTAGARRVVNTLRQNFVLIGTAGLDGHTLKIRPPLCFTAAHAAHFLEVLRAVLASLG
ncbi:MAG TPA: aminotransferase class III-fold pyridoxal phosphate-dependent enzyme [Acidocella sp.]|nr:aminotransferase class III-fold pyridoxal phosphate-dependent enzyme [Acidocella sp.]